MGPFAIPDEFSEECRGRDAAGLAFFAADVADICKSAFVHFNIFLVKRHAPYALECFFACSEENVGQLIVVGETANAMTAQGNDDRTGERGKVDDGFRL